MGRRHAVAAGDADAEDLNRLAPVGYGRLVKKHVLILGAGFGGLELATRLSETYEDAVRVTLLDRNDSFFFGFSKLEVMLGRQSSDDVRLYYRDIAKDAVEFRQETITG